MIGHGVFNNPDDTVYAALKTLKNELKGIDATVYLHSRPGQGNVWEKGNSAKRAGIEWETLNKS